MSNKTTQVAQRSKILTIERNPRSGGGTNKDHPFKRGILYIDFANETNLARKYNDSHRCGASLVPGFSWGLIGYQTALGKS